jgi:hypothetical protein
VINKGGYIGPSTAREIAYAMFLNNRIVFIERNAGIEWVEYNGKSLAFMVSEFAQNKIPQLPLSTFLQYV